MGPTPFIYWLAMKTAKKMSDQEGLDKFRGLVNTLFPHNVFPPRENDLVGVQCMDDILDYDPIYVEWSSKALELQPLQLSLSFPPSDTMQRHAGLYNFEWAPTEGGCFLQIKNRYL
jgi:hypothetical protein